MRPFFVLLFCFFFPSVAHAQKIVASIAPIHSLVQKIAGEDQQVDLILSEGQSPHGVQLKPSQLFLLEDADVIFYVDDALETFLKRAKTVIKEPHYVALSHSSGLKEYDARTAGFLTLSGHEGTHNHNHEDSHHEDHDDHVAHQHEDHHDHENDHHEDHHDHEAHHHDHDDHHGHDHSTVDLHFWLDPENAKVMLREIAEELTKIYPEKEAVFAENLQKAEQELIELDAQLKQKLQGLEDVNFVTFHDAYQYFERAYHLSVLGTIVATPTEMPSAARLSELRDLIKDQQVACAFKEPQFSPRLVSMLERETAIQTATLDPIGVNLKNGSNHYNQLMLQMAEAIQNCR